LELSLSMYRKARGHWANLANSVRDVYKPDITIGEDSVIRGHWLDRLPAIDDDIQLMAKKLEQTERSTISQQFNVQSAIKEALGRPAARPSAVCNHIQPKHFKPGEPLDIELSVEKVSGSVQLHYRNVNHAERYKTVELQLKGKSYRAVIPAEYTDSLYPLQYYFELKDNSENAWLYPGFTSDLTNQPYFVVRMKS